MNLFKLSPLLMALSRHENYLACVGTAMSAALQQLKGKAPAALADLRPAKLP